MLLDLVISVYQTGKSVMIGKKSEEPFLAKFWQNGSRKEKRAGKLIANPLILLVGRPRIELGTY